MKLSYINFLAFAILLSTTFKSSSSSSLLSSTQTQDYKLPDDEYLVGVGIADITGPAADINLMGYAKPNQDAGGIHLRQFSRTIIIQDKSNKRILFNTIDNGMISQLLRTELLKRLSSRYGPSVYNETNVMMQGGFFQYLLYNIPSAGFISQTLNSLVNGIALSIERAHENMKPAKIFYHEGELVDASINRSPISYRNNPASERAKYKYDTDKIMQLLKVLDSKTNEPIAMLNWFAVHGTSMNNTNHLISSDNKGYASILFEEDFNPKGTLPGKGKFVAFFAQANEGDVSPNTQGPRCIDTGLPCDLITSTCGNPPRNEKCIAFGPGKDMFESTQIIAHKQYQKAKQLFLDTDNFVQIRGPVRFIHEYIDMTKQVVPAYQSVINLARLKRAQNQDLTIPLNATYKTCQAALGYSFAAGTTDGPGAFDFQQADTVSGRYWNMVRDFLKKPTQEQIYCHQPKPILLSTGEMDFPYMWHPRIVPTQIFMIGQFAIVGLPGEFTTMSGRRIREAVAERLKNGADLDFFNDDSNDEDDDQTDDIVATNLMGNVLRRTKRAYSIANEVKVALSGLSNIYTSYVTTLEEYEVQRYEGASTLYGPHTLQAYVNQFRKLANYLISDEPLVTNSSLQPPDLTKSLFSLKTGVIFDGTPSGRHFGDVLKDISENEAYKCKDELEIEFVAGNPRNDLRHEGSFLYIDKFDGNGNWTVVATDSSWETKFIWQRTNTLLGESTAKIVWNIPHNCQTGIYRIRHFGASKSFLQTITQYSGQSKAFKVLGEDATDDVKTMVSLNNMQKLAQEAIDNSILEVGANEETLASPNVRHRGDESHKPTARAPLYSAISNLFSWLRS